MGQLKQNLIEAEENQDNAETLAESWINGNFSHVRFRLRGAAPFLYAHVALEILKRDEQIGKKFLVHLKNNPGWWSDPGRIAPL